MMYFAVMKLSFEEEESGRLADSSRELKSLAEKLRARFKVSAAAATAEETGGGDSVAVAALASSEEKLTQLLDAIVGFCEGAGLGRIGSEETLFDHIDAIGDYAPEGDD